MKNNLYKIMILCLVLMFVFSVNGIAQEDRTGTNAASELLIPVGARYLAMGGASVSSVEGLEAIFWNPAGVARSQYTANAMFSHMSHIADINMNYVAVSAAFPNLGTIGFSIKALDIGDIEETTIESPDGTGALLNPQFITAGLTYSRTLTDRIAVGFNIKLISETIERISASGFAVDFGVQYRDLASINGLSIGLVVKNLGPSIAFGGSGLLRQALPNDVDRGSSPLQVVAQKDELPSSLEIGLGYSIALGEQSKINISTVFQDNNFQDDVGRFGGEYNYNDLFFVRAGYSLSPDAADDPTGKSGFIYGLTAGAGVHYDFPQIGITVDYAYRDVDIFDASNIISVRLGF